MVWRKKTGHVITRRQKKNVNRIKKCQRNEKKKKIGENEKPEERKKETERKTGGILEETLY